MKRLLADGAWSAGLSAPWAPEYGPPGYRQIRAKDGLHFLSTNPQDSDDSEDIAAFTDPDGKVTIMPSVFDSIDDSGEPGLLASVLHHEAVHYTDLITKGWDTHEQLEIRADRASLTMVDEFMSWLPAKKRAEVKAHLRQRIAAAQALVDSGATHSPFPDLEQEKKELREQYGKETLTQDRGGGGLYLYWIFDQIGRLLGPLRVERIQRHHASLLAGSQP